MFWFMVEEITNYVGVALGDECAHTSRTDFRPSSSGMLCVLHMQPVCSCHATSRS